jgi:hypothetical protein
MADLGTDLYGLADIEPTLREISGRTALVHCCVRRLVTPRGGLFYDLEFGLDLRRFLHGQAPAQGTIENQIEAQLALDERVYDVTATVEFADDTMTVTIGLIDAQGPFELVLAVSAVSVELLRAA